MGRWGEAARTRASGRRHRGAWWKAGRGFRRLRLPALSATGIFDALPDWASGVLGEPLFVLGLVFVLFVLFVPRGLAGIRASLLRRPPAVSS